MKFEQDLCKSSWYYFKKLLWKDELNPRVRCAFGNVFFVIVIVDDEQFDVVVDEEVVVELVEVKISHLPALLLRSVIDPNQVYDFSVYYSFSWIWGLDVFPPGSAFWPRSCQGGLEGGHHGEEDDVHGREGQQHL